MYAVSEVKINEKWKMTANETINGDFVLPCRSRTLASCSFDAEKHWFPSARCNL
jgi:hypothetical protein